MLEAVLSGFGEARAAGKARVLGSARETVGGDARESRPAPAT